MGAMKKGQSRQAMKTGQSRKENKDKTIQRGQSRQENPDRTIKTRQSRQDNQDRTIKTGQSRNTGNIGGEIQYHFHKKTLIQQRLLLSLHNRTRTTLITLYFEGHISTHRPVTFSFSYEQPF